MLELDVIVMTLLASCWVLAAFSDLRDMTIPNAISLALVVGFIALVPFSNLSIETIAYCLLAAALTFAVCFCLFALNVMGGGDAKLLTASALWFGFSVELIGFLVHTALLGGLLTIFILLLSQRGPFLSLVAIFLPSSLTNGKKVPYGIAIAVAGLINLKQTILIQPPV